MAISEPRNTADAERLKVRTELLRDPIDVEVAEIVSKEYLALPAKPIVGTGGELMPMGNDPPIGIVDTVKNPNRVTARASLERINLAEKAGAFDLASDMAETIKASNSIEKAMAHQMAAAHVHVMKLLGEADRYPSPSDKARLANAAAKLMDSFQGGVQALAKLRGGGKQQVTVIHQHVQVAGGQVAVAGTIEKTDGVKEGVIEGGRSRNAG
jgi:hypothetical protein